MLDAITHLLVSAGILIGAVYLPTRPDAVAAPTLEARASTGAAGLGPVAHGAVSGAAPRIG